MAVLPISRSYISLWVEWVFVKPLLLNDVCQRIGIRDSLIAKKGYTLLAATQVKG